METLHIRRVSVFNSWCKKCCLTYTWRVNFFKIRAWNGIKTPLPPPPLRYPLLRKRQKEKEIMKMQYLFNFVHGDDKIPCTTIVGGRVPIERPLFIFVCSFLHDVNKKRTLRNLCGVGGRDWFVHDLCIPVQWNCNSDHLAHLVLSRCKMSLLLWWCCETVMMSVKVRIRSQGSLWLILRVRESRHKLYRNEPSSVTFESRFAVLAMI